MKTKDSFLFAFCLNVFVLFSFLTSCKDNEIESYDEILVVASEVVVKNEGSAYWVKRKGSTTWEMMHSQILNFDYERGYEYVIEVRVTENKDYGPDQSSHNYSLLKILSKEKKDSEVPLFTIDLSFFIIQDEIAFPNYSRELVTLPNGIKMEQADSFFIYQGDIVLNEDQINVLFNNSSNTKSGIVTNSIKYWHNHKVYYSFSSEFTLKQNVYDAIREWEAKTSLRFIESKNSKDYIEFIHGNGNYSNSLGRKTGKQIITYSALYPFTFSGDIRSLFV